MKASALDSSIQEVRIDNQRGAGAVPLNQEVDYFGLRVMMRPSTFLRLALPLQSDEYVQRMEDYIKDGGAIGAPFLSIDIPQAWEQDPPDFSQPAEVKSHDGRHRMMAVRRLEGDKPVEVHLFPIGLRNRHITPEWQEALRRGMVSQRSYNGIVRGPLFHDVTPVTEAKDIKACGDCFQAAARNMLHGTDDDVTLVHAYVSGQGKLQGRRFMHAWNEQGNTVIDNSNGRNIRMPREIYYAIGNVDPTDPEQFRRYDRLEAVRHMGRSRHYGPWDLKETVNRVHPVVPVTKQYPTQQRPKDPPVQDTTKKPKKPTSKPGVDLIAEQESNPYMSGHCHVMALALKTLHPTWQIRVHVGWDSDAEDDSDYRVDHVYIVDPDTGAAYDCRGQFANEQELVGRNTTGGVETQFVDYDLADIQHDIQRGELKRFNKEDLVKAIKFIQSRQDVAEGSDYEREPLYHATLKAFEPSIMKSGLLPGGNLRMFDWSDSKYVYLSNYPDTARDFVDPGVIEPNQEHEEQIFKLMKQGGVILKIDQNKLNRKLLSADPHFNTDADDGAETYIYSGTIPPSAIIGKEYFNINESKQGVAENFADGKKPGRKGLAKRVGINCKQPVSKLRKIAKSSSGERQRMAHWCANMKAGRK